MAEKKKIFNESDFDKDKQLFTSEDFEKNKDVPKDPIPEPTHKPDGGKDNGNEKGGKFKIIGGVAAAVAILAGVYFFGIRDRDKTVDDVIPPTGQVAQAGDATQPMVTSPSDVLEEGTAEEEETGSDAPGAVSPTEASEAPAKIRKEQSQTPAQPEDKKADKPSSVAPSATKPVQQTQSLKNNAAATQIASASAPIGDDVVENARRVIRGDFGNGQERKDKLGSAYSEIQSKVNELYRSGGLY